MSKENVKMCSKCHTLKPLVKHRSLCAECNLERKRTVAAKQYAKNPGKLRERARDWRESNPERAAEISTKASAKYYENNVNEILERARTADRASRDENLNAQRLRQLALLSESERQERDRMLRKAYVAARHVANPVPVLVHSAKGRSRRFGVPFSDKIEAPAAAAWKRGTCEVSGIPFSGTGGQSPFSMSIDRIEPQKGYVPGNVRFVCWWVNAACGSWGLEMILPAMRAIVDANR